MNKKNLRCLATHVPRALIPAALLLIVSFSTSAEAMQTELALDLDYVRPISTSGVDSGGGGALRFGQQLDLIAVTLTGELGASYYTFNGNDSPALYAGFAGGRLSVGKFIEPGIFVHVGASHLADPFGSSWAPLVDLGLSLDLTIFPLVDIGIHGAYAHRFANSETDKFQYIVVGPHVALIF